MEKVDIWLTGQVLEGTDPRKAATAFSQMTRLDAAQAQALITGGRPRAILHGKEARVGQELAQKLKAMGIAVVLRPAGAEADTKKTVASPKTAPATQSQSQTPAKPATAQSSSVTVDVAITGFLPDADEVQAALALSRLTGLNPKQALELLNSNKAKRIKRGVTPEVGQQYVARLGSLGMATRLFPAGTPDPLPVSAQTPAQAPKKAPANDPPRIVPHEFRDMDAPAAPPTGRRNLAPAPGRVPAKKIMTDDDPLPLSQTGMWRDQAEQLTASFGRNWLGEALELFTHEPLLWLSGLLVALFAPSMILFLPFLAIVLFLPDPLLPQHISLALTAFLFPLFAGGISLMAHRQKTGEKVRAALIFTGLWDNTVELLVLGMAPLLWLGSLWLVHSLLANTLLPGLLPKAFLLGEPGGIVLFTVFSLFAAIFLMAALLCAPGLVMLPGENGFRALFMSFGGACKNWSALLRGWPIGLPVTLMAVFLPWLAFFGGHGILTMTLLLVLLPLPTLYALFAFCATRDIFYDDHADL